MDEQKKLNEHSEEITYEEYKNIEKINRKRYKKREREDRGDVSSITSFKGPWALFKSEMLKDKEEQLEDTIRIRDERKMNKIVRADLLTIGNERSKFHTENPESEKLTFMRVPGGYTEYLNNLTCKIPKHNILTFNDHKSMITEIKFIDKFSHLLLTSSMDGNVYIYDTFKTNRMVRSFTGHGKGICGFEIIDNSLVTASYDNYIKEWDIEYGRCKARIGLESHPVCIVKNLNNRNFVKVGTSNGEIKVFDFRTKRSIFDYTRCKNRVSKIININEDLFCAISEDMTFKIWEDKNSEPIFTYEQKSRFGGLNIDSTKEKIVLKTEKNLIKVFDVKKMCFDEKTFKSDSNNLLCEIEVSPDNQFLSTTNLYGDVEFFNWKNGKFLKSKKMEDGIIRCISWNKEDLSKFVTGSDSGSIKIWN